MSSEQTSNKPQEPSVNEFILKLEPSFIGHLLLHIVSSG